MISLLLYLLLSLLLLFLLDYLCLFLLNLSLFLLLLSFFLCFLLLLSLRRGYRLGRCSWLGRGSGSWGRSSSFGSRSLRCSSCRWSSCSSGGSWGCRSWRFGRRWWNRRSNGLFNFFLCLGFLLLSLSLLFLSLCLCLLLLFLLFLLHVICDNFSFFFDKGFNLWAVWVCLEPLLRIDLLLFFFLRDLALLFNLLALHVRQFLPQISDFLILFKQIDLLILHRCHFLDRWEVLSFFFLLLWLLQVCHHVLNTSRIANLVELLLILFGLSLRLGGCWSRWRGRCSSWSGSWCCGRCWSGCCGRSSRGGRSRRRCLVDLGEESRLFQLDSVCLSCEEGHHGQTTVECNSHC